MIFYINQCSELQVYFFIWSIPTKKVTSATMPAAAPSLCSLPCGYYSLCQRGEANVLQMFCTPALMISAQFVDAESRTAVSHVEPQSHGGPAPHPAGPTDSGYRGSCSDTYVSLNMKYTQWNLISRWFTKWLSYCVQNNYFYAWHIQGIVKNVLPPHVCLA